MRRKIITIDEERCNGCGACLTACAEGALQLVNGKACLVKEQYCDGLGDCLGQCPTGALRVVEREADGFDLDATRRHVQAEGGPDAVQRLEAAARAHAAAAGPAAGGCPGTRARVHAPAAADARPAPAGAGPAHVVPSDLVHWPVQLHLVQPGAPFFKGRELVVLSTCAPVASADVHWRFLRGRAVVVGCPKLDRTEPYAGKLAGILADPTIPRVLVVRMEVPCCGGLSAIVRDAVARSSRADLAAAEVTLGLNGDVLGTRPL